MRKLARSVLLILGGLACLASPAAAQIPGCGTVTPRMDIWQLDRTVHPMTVDGYANISRAIDGCSIKLRTEAWVQGITMNVMTEESWGTAVTQWFSVPVPRYDSWTAIANNWAILLNWGWVWVGPSSDTAEIKAASDEDPPAEEEDPGEEEGDEPNDIACWNDPGCASPLLFDRDGNGFHLTNAQDGVLFDLNADGTLDRVAWTQADSKDGWLAYDRNGNGRIDDGTELFGNNTPAFRGQRSLTAANGFEALRFMQMPDWGSSIGDEQMDRQDAVFGGLLLWTDKNHNGISEPDELESASAAGLVGVGLNYEEKRRQDQHGNAFRLKGDSTWLNKQGEAKNEVVYDVWLRIAR